MPSFWSAVANMAWNRRRSKCRPSARLVSRARLTASLTIWAAGEDWAAIFWAAFRASAISMSAGTTRAASPQLSASAASMVRPVRHRSIALDLPTMRVRRWLPPRPGMMPRVISGWPNLAVSAAMMKSQASASSQPPPRAWPATAAMMGFLMRAMRSN